MCSAPWRASPPGCPPSSPSASSPAGPTGGSTRTSTCSPRRWPASPARTGHGARGARWRTSRSPSRPRCCSASLRRRWATRTAPDGWGRPAAGRSGRCPPGSTPPRSWSARSRCDRVEWARYYRPERLPGVEALHARFVAHEYRPHSHPTWTVAVMRGGAARFTVDAAPHRAHGGELFVLEPEAVHTGMRAVPDGWAYEVLYLDPGL